MGNAPGYPSYLLDSRRLQAYKAEGCGRRMVRHWCDSACCYDNLESEFVVERDGQGVHAQDESFSLAFGTSIFRYVGIASDGLLSFRHRGTGRAISLPEVLKHVVDIRAPAGKFVERSSRFFLDKTCPKLDWQHVDDYGVAMIDLGKRP